MNRCLLTLLVVCALSCAKEVARVAAASNEIEANLDASKSVDLWVELDISFEGEAQILFDVDLQQAGRSVATVRCNAFEIGTKMMAVETNFNGKNDKRYQGKMMCSTNVPTTAATKLLVTRTISPNIDIRKLELVVKQ